MCSLLSSSSITRLLWYYEAIRLPVPHLPSSLFSCPAYSLCCKRDTGPPGLPCNHNVKHAMVSDPEEAGFTLPFAVMPMLTSTSITVSPFPPHRQGLATRWMAILPGRDSHPLNYTTLPGRTINLSPFIKGSTTSSLNDFKAKGFLKQLTGYL